MTAAETPDTIEGAGDVVRLRRAVEWVVHVTEIRLRQDDPWDVCDVGVYPTSDGLESTIANLSDRLDRELDRQGETDRKRYVTRTLGGGLLREVRVET